MLKKPFFALVFVFVTVAEDDFFPHPPRRFKHSEHPSFLLLICYFLLKNALKCNILFQEAKEAPCFIQLRNSVI